MRRIKPNLIVASVVLLGACTMIQKPASVHVGSSAPVASSVIAQPVDKVSTPNQVNDDYAAHTPKAAASTKSLGVADLATIAKSAQKNPQAAKKHAGDTLTGQAKFIKAPKGNPNAVVADVRVAGLGEVSLWCRNVLGAAPAGKVVSFEGVLTGSVYTSEDFSHDVTMKDCRFRE